MLLNYHIGRLVLSSLCVGDLVRLVLSGARFTGFSLQHEHQISNTQRTENKTTDVVHTHSRTKTRNRTTTSDGHPIADAS